MLKTMIGVEMAGFAQAKEIEHWLEPTPVEQGLVTAMIEQRDNWPAIYCEMTKVTKKDLLSDAEFCARHKRPSLTAFFVECGEIGGVKISLLRKYQRAGSYYESALTRYPDLPPLTDEKVRNTPPDLFDLVAKIIHQIRKSGSASVETRGQIEYYYLVSLLDGKIARKDLNKAYSLVNGEKTWSGAERAICNLMESASLINPSAIPIQMRGTKIEDDICGILSDVNWLTYLGNAKVPEETVSVSFSGSSLFLGASPKCISGVVIPDLVVIEDVTGQSRCHAFDVKSSGGLENARAIHRLNNWAKASSDGDNAFDLIWVATDECDLNKSDLLELGLDERIGVLCLNGKGLRVIREPEQLEIDAQAQLSLYKATTLLLATND